MHKRIHLQTWHSPDGHIFIQIDHCLIDGRHFSDVIDVMARRGANIDSDHMLVVIRLRSRTCRASNTKAQQLRRFAVDRLKNRDVASRYYDELVSELQWCNGERGKERRQKASHPNQNQRSQNCLQTSPDKREAFVQKKGKAARRRGFN
jgi:hypothetical protein